MAAFVSFSSSSSSSQAYSKYFTAADNLRRIIPAKLHEMEKLLEESDDVMTGLLKNWIRIFKASFAAQKDTQMLLKEHIGRLQDILKDPCSGGFLNEPFLLGSDGVTYSHKSLSVFVSQMPSNLQGRSPRNLNDPTPFTVRPHPNADVMVLMIAWLKDNHQYVESERTAKEYEHLRVLNKIPVIPSAAAAAAKGANPLQERIKRILAEQEEKDKAENETMEKVREQYALLAGSAAASYAEIGRKSKEDADMHLKMLSAAEKSFKDSMDQCLLRIDGLRNEIVALEAENKQLREENEKIRQKIDEVEQQDRKLRELIQETQLAIKKRDEAWAKGLCIALGTIGACAFATIALQGLLVAGTSSAGAAILPVSGGAKAVVVFPF